jgi:IS1 family transposase
MKFVVNFLISRQENCDFDAKKKSTEVVTVNPYIGSRQIAVEIRHLIYLPISSRLDEQWSYVGNKKNQRWLWYAIDSATGCVLSFVFGRRKDEVFDKLISNLKAFNICRYFTDDWPSYSKFIPKDKHVIGKKGKYAKNRKKPFIQDTNQTIGT